MKLLQDIFSLNQNMTKKWIFGILVIGVFLTATVSAAIDISGVPNIVIPTPTPQTVACVEPSQCLMQSDVSVGKDMYVQTSDIPCGYVTVLDNKGSQVFPAYCYQKKSVPSVMAPLDVTTDPQISDPFTGKTSVVVISPNAPANTGTQLPVAEGTMVQETLTGTDKTSEISQPVAMINPRQEIPVAQPVFAGELLTDETNREEILATLQQENPAINTIRGDVNSVGIEYGRKAKLFGVFETPFTETVTVGRNGNIRVDQPWWLTFATKDKNDQLDPLDLQNTLHEREPGFIAFAKSHTTV